MSDQTNHRKNTILALLFFAAGVIPWLFTSDVARLIVLARVVVLGRYALPWFLILSLGITPACWSTAWVFWRSRTRRAGPTIARITAVYVSVALGVVVLDIALRGVQPSFYAKSELKTWPAGWEGQQVSTRIPGGRYTTAFQDAASHPCSYPWRPTPPPARDITLSIDTKGYRNAKALDRCDVVTIGDSFTEGLNVSDGEPWPDRLNERLEAQVYNLGITGADPAAYLRTLALAGVPMKPRVAVVMLYQENDFWGAVDAVGMATHFRERSWISMRIDTTPLMLIADLVDRSFGAINTDGPFPDLEPARWVPVAIPNEPDAPHYTLNPKRLQRLTPTREAFRGSPGWQDTAKRLRRMQAVCDEAGVKLLLVYAPSKVQVVLSLVRDRVSPEALHAFVTMARQWAPEPKVLADSVYGGLNSQEDVLTEFCRAEGIELESLTPVIRDEVAAGRQVFFTWDEHWTVLGHDIVAAALRDRVSALLSAK